jgi:hypothetical protein
MMRVLKSKFFGGGPVTVSVLSESRLPEYETRILHRRKAKMALSRYHLQFSQIVSAVLMAGLLSGCDYHGLSSDRIKSIQQEPPGTSSTVLANETPSQTDPLSSAQGATLAPYNSSYGSTNAHVELKDCVAKVVDRLTHKITINYRFTQGQPDPRREYVITVSFPGSIFMENKRFAGNQLAMAGKLEWNFTHGEMTLPPPPQLPGNTNAFSEIKVTEIKVTMSEQVGQHSYSGISQIEFPGTVISD